MNLTVESKSTVHKLIKSYITMILFGIIVTFFAVLTAWVFNTYYPLKSSYVKYIEYSGYICWAASLAPLRWTIQTWGGSSREEILDQKLTNFFSMLGIFAFVLTSSLKVIPN